MAIPPWLASVLTRYGIPYEGCQLPLPPADGRAARTEFLACHGRPVAVVLPAAARLDLERVKEVVDRADLRPAFEVEIASWFKGCHPNSVPPLRLRSDLTILMDRSLASLGTVLFPAGTPGTAVRLRFRDWYRAVRPGVGHFTVPAEEANRPANAAPILVVEDEADTNFLLCRLLEQEGHTCRGVEEGRRALDAAAEVQPSAILLDLMLPDMSGFEVYERLRRSGPLKRIPVIVVSALDDEDCRRRSRELGADAYLTKPFLPGKLMRELADVLGI